MEVIRIGNIAAAINPRGVAARRLIERDAVQVVNLDLKPGEVVKTHVTPVDVFFYVIEGSGTVEIGNESERVRAGDIVVSPKNIPHGLRAGENDRFSVLVVKTPNPSRVKDDRR